LLAADRWRKSLAQYTARFGVWRFMRNSSRSIKGKPVKKSGSGQAILLIAIRLPVSHQKDIRAVHPHGLTYGKAA
jgi:hypothetical protein